MSWQAWALGGGILALALGGGTTGYVYGGSAIRSGVSRDPGKLLKPFAAKLNTLFKRMRARGFKPMLWEAFRSPARAGRLADKGTGIRLSMHSLGAAVDIVDADKLWGASRAFWDALGFEAGRLGLVWGGLWRSPDRPHVQALTVSDQNAFRAMVPSQRASFVA
jgi:hypothetical protein